MKSPTSRTLELLRRSGYLAATVERWNSHAKIRQDLFGFADIVAVNDHRGERLLVQCTTGSNLAARVTKAKGLAALGICLRAGFAVEFWGWTKRGEKWEVRRVTVRAEDLSEVVIQAPKRRFRQPIQRGLFDEFSSGQTPRGG